MPNPIRGRRTRMAIAAALLAMLLPGAVLAAGTVEVNPTDLGSTWSWTGLGAGTGRFVTGPANPPLGTGSFEMTTTVENVDKSTLETGDFLGAPLSDLSALSYSTYRSGTSTSAPYITPSVNISIFTNASGPGTGFATLVFEPLYAYGNDAINDDVWQDWDAFEPTHTGFAGGWWVTRDVGALCAFACYADFATILANAPDATVLSVGLNVGRGPASFIGAVDALSVTMAGETTTYDFEPLVLDKDGCKQGGWVDFHAPLFRNQGDCVSWFASDGRNDGDGASAAAEAEAKAAAKAERAEARVTRQELRATSTSPTATANPANVGKDKPANDKSTKAASEAHGKTD
jgi:hypothetical protein